MRLFISSTVCLKNNQPQIVTEIFLKGLHMPLSLQGSVQLGDPPEQAMGRSQQMFCQFCFGQMLQIHSYRAIIPHLPVAPNG